MTRAHPSPETLTEYASGALKTGGRLVLGVHLKACAACREDVARLEMIGGALLAAEPEAGLEPNALDRALAALERPERSEPKRMTLEDMTRGLWMPIGADQEQPLAYGDETCLCLSASEGPVKLAGLARLAQIFLRV